MSEATFRRLIFRASRRRASVPLPFGARSAGHYRLDAGMVDTVRRKNFVQVFWGVDGEGEFDLDSEAVIMRTGQIFIYFPGDAHILKPVTGLWEYRWLTMDGKLGRATVEGFGLKRGLQEAGTCPEELFIQLEASLRDITASGERRAAVIAFSILARACGSRPVIRREDAAGAEFLGLIEDGFADPDFSVIAASQELGRNRTSLSREFKTAMGMSPQEYVNLLRMQKAMSLLKETDLHVAEIAFEVGYRDANYFARIFRQKTGMVPTAFRAE